MAINHYAASTGCAILAEIKTKACSNRLLYDRWTKESGQIRHVLRND